MRTYAIADIHGRYDLLVLALEKIAGHSGGRGGRVIFLGDYVDRGPQSRQVIETLMAGPPDGLEWICLKGNHEDMMVEVCRGKAQMSWWLGNGGNQTLISYGLKYGDMADPAVVPSEHLEWMDRRPLYVNDVHRIFVHAGLDCTLPLDDQSEQNLIWMRYHRRDNMGYRGKHVVHGHEQYEDGPLLLSNRTDLDAFAWYTGRLVIGVFNEDEATGPDEIIEVIAEPAFACPPL